MHKRHYILLSGLALIAIVIGFWFARQFLFVPLATERVFSRPADYAGWRFRFQGCLEPRQCTMAREECSIDRLEACCDCVQNYGACLGVDFQVVAKVKLVEIRETDEAKHYVEVVGKVVPISEMRPIAIEATDLTILGECPAR